MLRTVSTGLLVMAALVSVALSTVSLVSAISPDGSWALKLSLAAATLMTALLLLIVAYLAFNADWLEEIRLVRHGYSEQNSGKVKANEVGDCNIKLEPLGIEQAQEAGPKLGRDYILAAVIWVSPYVRTVSTAVNAIIGAGLQAELESGRIRLHEEGAIREMEFGYDDDVKEQEAMRLTHGWYYYRFRGGESPADVCDGRVNSFIISLWNQVRRKRARKGLIFGHGLTNRLFVKRWFHLTVDQYNSIANPENGDIIVIKLLRKFKKGETPQFKSGRWGVTGLRFRKPAGAA